MGKKKKQPWGIIVNFIVLLITGILVLLVALAFMALGSLMELTDVLPIAGLMGAIVIMLLLLGVFELILAYGIWNHKLWAWWILVVFGVIGVITDIFAILSGTVSIVGMIFGIVLLAGLLHRDTIKAIKPNIDWKGWKA